MLRIRHKTDAQAVKNYMRQSDYYLETAGDWMGKGAARLGLTGRARQEDFDALCDNLRPDGSPLTAKTVEGRRIGYDFNFNAVKSVGIAREIIGHYDPAEGQRIEDAHRQAVAYAMGFVEEDMAVRVRSGGRDDDETTGNMIAMRATHRTTRPNEDDHTPDMLLHDHVFVINASFDKDGEAKAAELGRVIHDAPYYEAIYHNRLAANLRAMGYGIRRTEKGFEVAGISDGLIERYSRRRATIKKHAAELGITSAEGFDKLGATTRLRKEDSRLVDLVPYWLGKLSDPEKEQIRDLRGHNSYRGDAESAVRYAIAHEFYRNSVVETRRLYETAIRHGIGGVTPEEVEAEARRQGVIYQGQECTTRGVLDQEDRIVGFARESRGTFRPLAPGKTDGLDGLSAEQAMAVRHIWNAKDGVILIRGAPGAGKTTMMQPALDRLGVPAVLLAPSSDASRGKLREDGFADANTVAAFLGSKDMQEKARNGLVYIDEASLLGIDDLERVCGLAKELKARVVLQGDPRQHKAVQRHGNMLEVLADYAGLPVAEIHQIMRQKGEYRQAVEAIRAGLYEQGVNILYKLGWIIEGEGHDKLVEHYAREVNDEVKARKGKRDLRSLLIVDPTHRDGEALTEKLRDLRKAAGLIKGDEQTFTRLTGLDWTPAQRADTARYAGDEVIQFYRNCGKFKAGQRVAAAELLPHLSEVKPEHFGVFKSSEIKLAAGDTVRITSNGRDVTGKHRVDNGRIDTIAGFTKEGGIRLSNGWVIAKDFGHLKLGLVSTSHSSQSKTKTDTWQQLNRVSLGAAGAEQFLVSLSRGQEHGLVFTDMSRDELVAAIRRADNRKSATEVFRPRPQPETAAGQPAQKRAAERTRELMERVRGTYRHLRRLAALRRGPERGPDLPQGRGPGPHAARAQESLRQREDVAYER
jgi:conjugative relaxase-like TrwC/TraI family protein